MFRFPRRLRSYPFRMFYLPCGMCSLPFVDGTKKDTQAVFTNNLHGHESPVAPEYTADGIVAKGMPELRMGVTDKLSGWRS